MDTLVRQDHAINALAKQLNQHDRDLLAVDSAIIGVQNEQRIETMKRLSMDERVSNRVSVLDEQVNNRVSALKEEAAAIKEESRQGFAGVERWCRETDMSHLQECERNEQTARRHQAEIQSLEENQLRRGGQESSWSGSNVASVASSGLSMLSSIIGSRSNASVARIMADSALVVEEERNRGIEIGGPGRQREVEAMNSGFPSGPTQNPR